MTATQLAQNLSLTKSREHSGGQGNSLRQPAEVYALLSMQQECLKCGV